MNNKRWKYVFCSLCGQMGLPLVNRGTNREKKYTCKDVSICERRQRLAKVAGKPICSEWFCPDVATYKCSCGAVLCSYHRNLVGHYGHLKEKLM